ncbi:TMV resistance protein N-like [Bidens hawaiensis]|uniref:TMV resistance protein N-like n=1 Tax=Bidens hawaiensis TaxID=980011 RepID=UPI00404A2D61
MASTSASSFEKSFKYDVFLSFRGEDTRKTFVDHLYHALCNRGITTYKDDEKIEKGERINEQLVRSIEDSRIHIIIFSKNYASSSWCLNELVKIMECEKTQEQTAYPVFYDVEPTEVRHQSGAVGEAFAKLVAKHEKGSGLFSFFKWFTRKRKRMVEDVEMKMMLQDGDVPWKRHEAKFIEKIIKDISPKLHLISLNVDDNLVGMETRLLNVVSSLELDSNDVLMIGTGGWEVVERRLWPELFLIIYPFILKVKALLRMSGNVHKALKGSSCSRYVDHIEHLAALAGTPNWFKPGSRIIITTRDEQVLIAHKVNKIHDVNLLSDQEALCLFSWHAFGREIPINGYKELSEKVVHYAAGLPLTIKVLGSHLCGRSELDWVDAINRLKNIPLKETLEKLELSYNGLENDQKEIFLDVVCVLKGETKYRAIRILESCGFNARIGLRVLEQKSLITISNGDGLDIHDHIEEMGRNIVRRLHPNEPSKHSRLWIKEEIKDILVNELGTKATRSINLGYSNLHSDIITKGIRKIEELRLLNVQCKVTEVDEVNKYLPDALQYLCWTNYPFQSLPETFQANNLVNLDMCHSNITELWEGGERKVFNKLKYLDLSYSSKLRTFDLSITPHLELLNLTRCEDLVELCMPVEFPNLKSLNLSRSKVINLNIGLTPNLERLYLEGCSHLKEIHAPVECLKKLVHLFSSECLNLVYYTVDKKHESASIDTVEINVSCVDVYPLHATNDLLGFRFTCIYDEPRSSWSGNLEKLFRFGPCACENPEYFLATICDLQHLRELTLEKRIHGDIWRLESLEKLSLWWQKFQHLPDSICLLKNLKSLELYLCLALEQLPGNICRLECLEVLRIIGSESLRDIPSTICKMRCLKHLVLSNCKNIKKLPEELGSLECLKELWIKGTDISLLPQSIYQLKGLRICGSREQLESYGFTSVIDSVVEVSLEYAYIEL